MKDGRIKMVIKIRNAALKAQVFKRMNRYDDIALTAYKRGDMRTGKTYENKSDRLYDKNYKKMFRVE